MNASTNIIDGFQKKHIKPIEFFITFTGWSLMLGYVVQIILSLLIWAFNLSNFYRKLIVGNLYTTVTTFLITIGSSLFGFLILFGWGKYNYKRYAHLNRRKFPNDVSVEDLAHYFMLPTEVVAKMQNTKLMHLEKTFNLPRDTINKQQYIFDHKDLEFKQGLDQKPASTGPQIQVNPLPVLRQRYLAGRGYALLELGFWSEAISQFKKAIEINPNSSIVPVFLTEIASAYNEIGKHEWANLELVKAELLTKLKQAVDGNASKVIVLPARQQQLLANNGYALLELGCWREAIAQFRKAINVNSYSSMVPVLLTEIAFAYNELGEYEIVNHELAKTEILANLLGKNLSA